MPAHRMPAHSLDVLSSLDPAVPAAVAELAARWDPSAAPAAPRAAATVVLCRDGPAGLETYLLHRHARMSFAASMVVFPGGGVDPVDRTDVDPLLACAVRETREETGVALAAADLVPWAHWITPAVHPLRYDTLFYLAALPQGEEAADLSTETERACWTAPAAAVDDQRAGALSMMPPTLSILIELAAVRSVAEALALGQQRVIQTVLPEVVRHQGGWIFRYPMPGSPAATR